MTERKKITNALWNKKNSYRYVIYRRNWMRMDRKRKRQDMLIKDGKCPVCEMSLDTQFDIYHSGCIFFERLIFHATIATYSGTIGTIHKKPFLR